MNSILEFLKQFKFNFSPFQFLSSKGMQMWGFE